jgi:RNA polymerase sigma factor FliA
MESAAAATTHEAGLWERLRRKQDEHARAELLALHMPYARTIAAVLYGRRMNEEIEFADYLQFACVGLIEALDRYDPLRGVQFRTFASRRMQGAVLSGLERCTEKQQQIAARQRLRAARGHDVKAAALEGAPSSAAQHPAELLRFISEVGIGLAVCWMLEGSGLVENAAQSESIPFYRPAAVKQLRTRLLHAIDSLPEQERSVLRSHYLQQISFDEVARTLQLTKGRISQIHKQALARLRQVLRDHGDWEATF